MLWFHFNGSISQSNSLLDSNRHKWHVKTIGKQKVNVWVIMSPKWNFIFFQVIANSQTTRIKIMYFSKIKKRYITDNQTFLQSELISFKDYFAIILVFEIVRSLFSWPFLDRIFQIRFLFLTYLHTTAQYLNLGGKNFLEDTRQLFPNMIR